MPEHDELLTIKQAAKLLKVSETSLRRWTNAGELVSFRIGKRKERRFRRADLLAFLHKGSQSTHATDGEVYDAPLLQADRTAVAIADRGHLCGVYESDEGLARLAVAFMDDGRDDVTRILVAEKTVRDKVLALLLQLRPAMAATLDSGQLIAADYRASIRDQIGYFQGQCRAAIEAGARSIRIVGDVRRFARRNSMAQVVPYEAEYDRTIARRFPVVTLCLYDARAFSGLGLFEALKGHPDNFCYPVAGLLA